MPEPLPPDRRLSPLARPARSSLLLLAASLGLVALTAILAVGTAWRSRANTRQLLRDYAAFAAWSYREHLSGDLEETTWLSLSPIGHREPHSRLRYPEAAALRGYRATNVAQCHCDQPTQPATYFRFSLGESSLMTDGPVLTEAVAAAIPPTIRTLVHRDEVGPRNGIGRLPGRRDLVAFGLMPTTWGDTIVYGFTFDSAGLAAGFDSVLTRSSLLPKTVTRGHPNRELFTYEIRDTSGTIHQRGAHWPRDEREWPFIAAETLPPLTGGFIVRVTLIPESAPTLLTGGLPTTQLPLLALVGILGVAVAGVALVQLRREAELLRLRRDFVAGASHELRTPLAQLRLFLDTLRLKRYDTPAEQDWLVGHLSRETTRLEHLVENVLAASRLDQGMQASAPLLPLDLSRAVRETITAYEPLAASRRVRFTAEVTEGIQVLADPAAFRQLLLNLLDNAVKFGPPGQTVRVVLARAGTDAELRVADEGPGIPEAERDRIWEPYFRGRSAGAAAAGGTGIGLAIVREIVSRFGGTVATTTRTAGAEFVVTLPLADAGEARA